MNNGLSAELVARIKTRLRDDWRLTGEGDWQRTPKRLRRKSEVTHPVGMLLESVLESQVFAKAPLDPPKPVVPLDEKAVAKVEKTLGFRLPGDLRQLYLELGDGNFGPFNGIRRLANWAKDYARLRAELPAERNREWPEALLPIVYLNGKRICLDRDSGAVVLWTKPPKKAGEKKWLASFVPQAGSLAEWLERWVDTPTWCEGGPDGGWLPRAEELERRAAVERGQKERKAAALARARRIAFGEHPPLPEELIERIAERAADPRRRTRFAGAEARSRPLDIAGMARDVEDNPHIDPALKKQLGTMATGVGLMAGLGKLLGMPALRVSSDGGPGFAMMFEGAGGKLGRPVGREAFARSEEELGFALPVPLRQLYELADGGFGPGDAGFWPLRQVVKDYREKTTRPQGPNDEPWPARLLPLFTEDPAVICLDLESGAIVIHDVQEMDHLGHGQWARSFLPGPPSLATLLEKWLGGPPLARKRA